MYIYIHACIGINFDFINSHDPIVCNAYPSYLMHRRIGNELFIWASTLAFQDKHNKYKHMPINLCIEEGPQWKFTLPRYFEGPFPQICPNVRIYIFTLRKRTSIYIYECIHIYIYI